MKVTLVARTSGPYRALVGWKTTATVGGDTRTFRALTAGASRAKAKAWVDGHIYVDSPDLGKKRFKIG